MLPTVTCEECGGAFVAQRPPGEGYRAVRYCSKPCRKRAQVRRYRARSQGRASRVSDVARRSPLGWDAVVERFDPLEVYERDAWLCRLCGRPLDRDADPALDREAPTLDHVRPVEDGGRHELGNVRAAHRACNSARAMRHRRRRSVVWDVVLFGLRAPPVLA
jgi:5-methylcytosine-specific restriction endonuclease McrA